MRNEAQLAGVIAHESGHFLRRHMIRSWRDMKRKSDIFAIGAMAAGIGGGAAGIYLGDYVQLAQLAHDPFAVPVQPRDGGGGRRHGRAPDRRGRLPADGDGDTSGSS